MTRWEGVDEGLAKMVTTANLDGAANRRLIREAFKNFQLRIDHCLFKAEYEGIKMKESYEVNSRGLEIFTKRWLPENSPLKALVFFCHGYGDTCTFFVEGIAKKIASAGYAFFAMDYPGFGLSEGLHGYIPSFDNLVNDVVEHFSKIKENPEFKGLPSFLFGQSMGGAVALKVHLKQPQLWDGAILLAPMCKIADDVIPPWPLVHLLIGLAKVLPKEKLVPQKDLAEMAFKDLKKREQTSYNVIAYKGKPRLRTAVEMLQTTQEIERRLEELRFFSSKHHAYSQKQKSLDLLCSNFVSLYNKDDVDKICLDDATMKLGVERRGSSCSFDLRLVIMAAGTLPPLTSIVEVIYRIQYSLIEYPSCSAEQLVTAGSILSRSDYQF